jgi:hypothetical protein
LKSCAISGLVKEAFSNASKFDLLSVKIIVEPGKRRMLPIGQLILIERQLYQMKVEWFAESREFDILYPGAANFFVHL